MKKNRQIEPFSIFQDLGIPPSASVSGRFPSPGHSTDNSVEGITETIPTEQTEPKESLRPPSGKKRLKSLDTFRG